jgi:hypothetical protein
MKKGENIFTKITVVSLSVLYLFIALTYVLFLPNYNTLRTGNKHVSYTHTLLSPANKHVSNNADRAPLLEKVFKTTVQYKKGIFIALLQAATVITMAVMAAGFAINKRLQLVYADAHRHTYLQVRALRI